MNIAIIGLSGIYPKSETLKKFHENLAGSIDCVGSVSEQRRELLGLDKNIQYQEIGFIEDIDCFDHDFFNISHKEAVNMCPEQRISLELAAKAILDAGYTLESFRGSSCGVFVAGQEYEYYSMLSEKNGLNLIGGMRSILPGRIAYNLDLHGPNMIVDTACSSALVCLEEACRRLEYGDIEYALVGGITIYLKFGKQNRDGDLLGIEAGNGRCKPFDDSADGIGVGEGGGFILLKRLEAAEADGDNILAVVKSAAVNSDGVRCSSMTTPSVEGQKECIMKAWIQAGIDPCSITELEAHGTGTKLGDPIEIESFTESYNEFTSVPRETPIYVGSVKGNTGHLNGTAAMASITKVLLEFKHNMIYPICSFKKPNSFIDFANSPTKPVDSLIKLSADQKRVVSINSFGLSGTNATAVIENYFNAAETPASADDIIVKVSAASETSFAAYVKELSDYLNDNELTKEMIYTLNAGRDDYKYRKVLTASDKAGLQSLLSSGIKPAVKAKPKKILLIMSDCGAEEAGYYSMLRSLGIRHQYLIGDELGRQIASSKGIDPAELEKQVGKNTAIDEDELAQKIAPLINEGVYAIRLGRNIPSEINGVVNVRGIADIYRIIAELYESGADISWNSLYKDKHLRRVSAPTYVFDKYRHWGKLITDSTAVSEADNTAESEELIPVENMEENLKNIWVKLLECDAEDVEYDTDFFDLGGNSLLIAMLIKEIRKSYGVDLDVEDIYDYYTIEMQKELIEERFDDITAADVKAADEKKTSTVSAADDKYIKPIPMQQLMINALKEKPDNSRWDLMLTFRVEGRLDIERMKAAFLAVCGRHALMRSRLCLHDGGYVFEVIDDVPNEAQFIDMSDDPNAKADIKNILTEESLSPINFDSAFLSYLKLYKLEEQLYYFLFKISHTIADGSALTVFFEELCSEYMHIPHKKEVPPRFVDYAVHEKECLEAPELIEHTKKYLPAVTAERQLTVKYPDAGSVASAELIIIPGDRFKKIKSYARAHKVSLFQLTLAVYHLSVQKFLERDKSYIGVIASNRDDPDYNDVIGLLIKLHPSFLQADDDLEKMLMQVKSDTNSMMAHQMCSVSSYIGENGKNTFDDFAEFLLTYQNFRNSEIDIEGLKFSSHLRTQSEAICPMTLMAYDTPEALIGTIQYDPVYFSREDTKRFAKIFNENINTLIK